MLFRSPSSELNSAFGTDDVQKIVEKIVKDGEIQITQDYRNEEKEKKIKQIVDFLATNSIDPQTKYPHTPERIKRALDEAHVNIKNVPIENQIKEIIDSLSSIIPIKLETKRIKIVIPASYTGKVYGLVSQYKEDERWLDDGGLEIVVSVPSGIVMDFYEKLN